MDLSNGTSAWTDWNVLLDERGGPNHVGNFCYAPIHADTKTGELTYMNSYYYLGHFSKFVRPGAKRVATVTTTIDFRPLPSRTRTASWPSSVLNLSDETVPSASGSTARRPRTRARPTRS